MSKINLNKSTPTKFQLVFPKLPTDDNISEAREFVLNIFGTVLPNVSLDVSKKSYLGWEINSSTGNMQFAEWTIEFNVDEEFSNWFKIFEWMKLINNNNDYMYDSESDFLVDGSLLILDDYNSVVKTVEFKNVFPSNLDSINFSKREGENILESSCTLNFDYFKIKET